MAATELRLRTFTSQLASEPAGIRLRDGPRRHLEIEVTDAAAGGRRDRIRLRCGGGGRRVAPEVDQDAPDHLIGCRRVAHASPERLGDDRAAPGTRSALDRRQVVGRSRAGRRALGHHDAIPRVERDGPGDGAIARGGGLHTPVDQQVEPAARARRVERLLRHHRRGAHVRDRTGRIAPPVEAQQQLRAGGLREQIAGRRIATPDRARVLVQSRPRGRALGHPHRAQRDRRRRRAAAAVAGGRDDHLIAEQQVEPAGSAAGRSSLESVTEQRADPNVTPSRKLPSEISDEAVDSAANPNLVMVCPAGTR